MNDNASGNHANVLNNSDETGVDNHGAGIILEDLLGVTFPISSQSSNDKFNSHGLTFMIHGNLKVANFMSDGVRIKGTTEGFKKGSLNKYTFDDYWINGYNGPNTTHGDYVPSMCIDSSLSWTHADTGSVSTYAERDGNHFIRRGQGFVVGNTICSFKFFGLKNFDQSIANLGSKYQMYDHLKRRGTQFRIIDDPTNTVYTVVNVRLRTGVYNNHVGPIGFYGDTLGLLMVIGLVLIPQTL